MASLVEIFLIVDLLTASVPYVAVVPDFWVKEGRCSYPKKRGDVAAIRLEKPKENWLVYDCIVRKQFDSFQAAKDKENPACEQNVLTTTSEAENASGILGGKGCRKKTPTRKYSPTTDLDDSGESSDGMYGPTQDILPSIPIPSGLQQKNTNLVVSNVHQSNVPVPRHFEFSSNELATAGPHSFSNATKSQENFDMPYTLQPSKEQRPFQTASSQQQHSFHIAPSQHLSNFETRQSNGIHFQAPLPSQPLADLNVSSNEPRPKNSNASSSPQYSNWSASYSETPSARHHASNMQYPSNHQTYCNESYAGTTIAGQLSLSAQPSRMPVHRFVKRFSPMPSSGTEQSKDSVENIMVMDSFDKMVREFAKQKEIQNVFLSKLTSIEAKLDNIQKVESVSNYMEEQGPGELLLPLGDMRAVKPFEESLADKDKYFKLTALIRGIGGSSLSDAIKRAWTTVFSLKVRAGCNWEGKLRNGTRKHGLDKSPITRAIFEGVKGVPQFRNAKQSELEWETKNLMKRAPEQVRSEEAAAPDGNVHIDEPPTKGETVNIYQPPN